MAVDFFLKLDGIDGESADDKHPKEITVMSFSWGGSQVTSVSGSGGSGAGKVSLADLSIMKNYDAASTPLFKAMCLGTHIKTGVLTAVKSGANGAPFLQVNLGELFVTSIQISGSSEIPMESVSFSYNTIKMQYWQQDETGKLAAKSPVTYDLKANKVS
ncbi:type VI secretion system secreted protein Hcp [Bryocella elongata]|uniref:Type VI secretion system secreted protein Hcp n=1 Tax=Bryocella elongata TaxID=863522 RepID=A0A1H6AC42_9BACT|nr:type VI secretion system tube protein Hcp [Bryocella elongata]SEG46293.1 type VI secretion system secreted protein Hcp [Bryocella elongata]